MKQVINWRYFKDEMPTENGYYLVKLENELPLTGYITITNRMYNFDYARKKENSVQYNSIGTHFDQKCLGRMVAWIPTEELL